MQKGLEDAVAEAKAGEVDRNREHFFKNDGTKERERTEDELKNRDVGHRRNQTGATAEKRKTRCDGRSNSSHCSNSDSNPTTQPV